MLFLWSKSCLLSIPPYLAVTAVYFNFSANSYKGRVTGGVEAIPNEFPWIVHIGKTCAGSIVNNRWLVTAATCVSGPPSSLTIVAGDHNERITERTEQLRNAIRVHKHPDLSYA